MAVLNDPSRKAYAISGDDINIAKVFMAEKALNIQSLMRVSGITVTGLSNILNQLDRTKNG